MNSLLRVSGRNHAGLILMADLAGHIKDEEYVTLQAVADRMGISQGYLEEIALSLKKADLIEGRKGPGGGYRLMDKPSKISIERILVALEGPLAMVECQDSDKSCPFERGCSTKNLWNFLQKDVLVTLKRTTLSDVIARKELDD